MTRQFHDVVLRDGAVPMSVLTGTVREWLDGKPRSRTGLDVSCPGISCPGISCPGLVFAEHGALAALSK